MGLDSRMTITGIKPPDDVWQGYKAVWEACRAAEIDPPDEVAEFFMHEDPVEEGVAVVLAGIDVARAAGSQFPKAPHASMVRRILEIEAGHSSVGYIVDLAALPDDMKWLKITVDSNW